MFSIFKKKLIITLVTATAVGGISTTTIPMFHNAHTTIKKSQASNIKENYTKERVAATKEDASKDTVSLSEEKNSTNDAQDSNNNTNNQEAVKKGNKNTNKQASMNPQIKDNNEQSATNNQEKETTNNVNIENQDSRNTTPKTEIQTFHYDRTTSIYANDNITLLRVEYYVNNKLTYYSVVEQFDASTKSYIEKIYQCNRETNIDPLIRTDVYVNGNIVKSY